jgi:DNA-binding transcriptional LysR family regulator
MTFKQLEIFVEVAKTASVSQAARNLYLSQPSVSFVLASLEKECGVPLFVRSKQRISLNEEGKRLLPYAQNILAQGKLFASEAANLSQKPSLRVVSSLAPGESFLTSLLAEYPSLKEISLHCQVTFSPVALALLKEGQADLAFLEGSYHGGDFASEELVDDYLAIVAAPSYLKNSVLDKEHLEGYAWLLRDKESGTRQQFDQELADAGYQVTPILESISNAPLLAAAEKGLGLAVLPSSLCQDLIKQGRLKEVRVPGLSFKRVVSLVYDGKKSLSEAEKKFLVYVKSRFPR